MPNKLRTIQPYPTQVPIVKLFLELGKYAIHNTNLVKELGWHKFTT